MFGNAMGAMVGAGGGGNAGPMNQRPGMPMQGQNPGMLGQQAQMGARNAQMRNPMNPGMGPSMGMQQKMMPQQFPGQQMGNMMGQMKGQGGMNYGQMTGMGGQPMPMNNGGEAPEEVPGLNEVGQGNAAGPAPQYGNPMDRLMSQYGQGQRNPMQGGMRNPDPRMRNFGTGGMMNRAPNM